MKLVQKIYFLVFIFLISLSANPNPSIFIDVDFELNFKKEKMRDKKTGITTIRHQIKTIDFYYQFDFINSQYLISFNDLNNNSNFDKSELELFLQSSFLQSIAESNFFVSLNIDSVQVANIKDFISNFDIQNLNSQFILTFTLNLESFEVKDAFQIFVTDFDKMFGFRIYDDLTVNKFWNYPIRDYIFTIDDEVYDLIVEVFLQTNKI